MSHIPTPTDLICSRGVPVDQRTAPVHEPLTDRRAAAIPLPATGDTLIYDSRTAGLLLAVSSTGCRRWRFQKRSPTGKLVKVSIGPASLPIDDARERAADLLARVLRGEDPTADRRKARLAAAESRAKPKPLVLTVGQVWSAWMEQHAEQHLRPRTLIAVRSIWKLHLSQLAERPMASVTVAEAVQLHARIGAETGHVTANHAAAYARAVWRWAARTQAYAGPVPWSCIQRYQVQSRSRVVTDAELPRLLAAVHAAPADFRDFVTILLHVGARRGNVQRMTWDALDLSVGTWTIPASDFKGRRCIVLPLSPVVLGLLKTRHASAVGPWVFPSPRYPERPIADWRRQWRKICEQADLTDLHPHDMRRTLASLLARQGVPMLTVAAVLGHADATVTAKVYAKLDVASLRAPLAAASSALLLPDPTEAQAMSASRNAVGG